MFNRLVIIGAGGHGKVIADIAMKSGYRDIAFADDNSIGECMGFPIIGTCKDIKDDSETDYIIAIGNNEIRKKIAEQYHLPYITLIHPSAQIAVGVSIGCGTVVMANAVVNPGTVIGIHSIINTGAIVEHDNRIGSFVHISPNAALGGTVSVGDFAHVGIGATVRNNISVCNNCVIGAGTVVICDLTESGTYIGVPAHNISEES